MNLRRRIGAYDKSVAELYPTIPDKARKLRGGSGFRRGR